MACVSGKNSKVSRDKTLFNMVTGELRRMLDEANSKDFWEYLESLNTDATTMNEVRPIDPHHQRRNK